jgi:hypothetical protein
MVYSFPVQHPGFASRTSCLLWSGTNIVMMLDFWVIRNYHVIQTPIWFKAAVTDYARIVRVIVNAVFIVFRLPPHSRIVAGYGAFVVEEGHRMAVLGNQIRTLRVFTFVKITLYQVRMWQFNELWSCRTNHLLLGIITVISPRFRFVMIEMTGVVVCRWWIVMLFSGVVKYWTGWPINT